MSPLLERFKLWWSSVDRGQRPIYIVGAVFLVAMIIGSVIFAGKPQLSLLFAGLSPSDQGMVVGELNKMGINAQYDANGNVLVPGNKINEARAKLAANAAWFPKFMEGGKFAMQGSVVQRHIVKIA
jgi:flagellar M-ring protein FliF